MGKRPNILLITSDQQRGDCLGCEGRGVKTPHIDLLAEQGTRFAACITPNNVCQPTRASILTGLLPRTHGVADNGLDLPPATGEQGFAGRLSAAGYRSALIGKPHFATSHTFEPTGTPECRRSMQLYDKDWHGPYMGFDHVELMIEGHNQWPPSEPPSGQHYESWYYGDGLGELKNRLLATNVGPDTHGAPQTLHSGLPVAWHNSSWVGDRTVAYLSDHQANHSNQPFVLWASFPDPHHPFDCPVPWSLLHDPAEVDLPEHRTLDLERRPWWHRASLEGKPQIREDLAKIREEYSRVRQLSDEELREVIANTYGMLALIDHNVGRIMAELHRLGIADDTLVVYASDHGDWLGDHGLLLKGPMSYEGLMRVPLVMRGPGVPKGKVIDDPVSTLDLGATFLDTAGVERPAHWHSRSLLPVLRGDEDREFALNEWELNASRCGVELKLRTVRTRTHRMTLELVSGAGELYDLVADPHELNNLFDDPAYAAIQGALTAMIETRPDDALEPPLTPVGMA